MTAPRTPAIAFWGTPACAAQCLEYLVANGMRVAAAITQPDKPAGRGQTVGKPPVKSVAENAGIPVLQPASLKNSEVKETIAALDCSYHAVVAYGKIFPTSLLASAPPFINLHFSLLPKYRGAAPVQRALMDGCRQTGVTVQHVAEQCDTGDIILQQPLDVNDDDTTGSILDRCVAIGAPLLLEALVKLDAGTAPRTPQDHTLASRAPKIGKHDGFIVWEQPASRIYNQIRACNPWPGATTWFDGTPVRVWRAAVAGAAATDVCPGALVPAKHKLLVGTSCGIIELLEIQPANGRRMPGDAFIAGHRGGSGTFISWLPGAGHGDTAAS